MEEKIDNLLQTATGVNKIRLQRIRTLVVLNAHLTPSDKAVLKFNGI